MLFEIHLDDEDELSLPRPSWGHYLAEPLGWVAARQDSGPTNALAMIVRPIFLVVGNYFLNIKGDWTNYHCQGIRGATIFPQPQGGWMSFKRR